MTDQIKQIANHYGYEKQTIQAISELGELIQAITKLQLADGTYGADTIEKRIRNLHEEIADVEIMLGQLKYLFKCKYEVELIREEKVNRQLNRIKGEQLEAELK